MGTNYKEKLKHITTLIFDYDGVMSDGKVWTIAEQDQIRNADVKDGYAIHYALKKGYRMAIISGGRSESMVSRMNYIGIKDVYTGISNKKEKLEEYMLENDLTPDEILYMGDDIPDYEVMEMVGISTCPANAATEIKAIADYISHLPGGAGCVRDVIEQAMRSKGLWMQEDAFYW